MKLVIVGGVAGGASAAARAHGYSFFRGLVSSSDLSSPEPPRPLLEEGSKSG